MGDSGIPKAYLGYGWVVSGDDIPDEDKIMYIDCKDGNYFSGLIIAECVQGCNTSVVSSEIMHEIENKQLKLFKLYSEISGKAPYSFPRFVLINVRGEEN